MRKKIALIFGTPVFIVLLLSHFYKEDLSYLLKIGDIREEAAQIEAREREIVTLLKKFEEVSKIDSELIESQKKVAISDFSLTLPSGFNISIFAKGLGRPRDLEIGPNQVLHVSVPTTGEVLALPDIDRSGAADQILTVAEGLKKPHGLATYCSNDQCKFYIAETDQVSVFDYDASKMQVKNKNRLVVMPGEGVHHTRSLLFQDDLLLISVGSSCDVCEEQDWRHAKILSVNPDGSDFKEFASGLRNSVFMALHPKTNEVWATEMGRDLLGDNLPPDEVNVIKEGGNYGWPFCYGDNTYDTVFDPQERSSCDDKSPSHIDIPAHSAPLGLTFIPKGSWPQSYHHNLLVAYHGSWNRTEPTGYKIVRIELDDQGSIIRVHDFISGWLLENGESKGRPVDLIFHKEALYISDDKSGAIYRVTYGEDEQLPDTCIKTGCSGQICSDTEVITHCSHKPEYDCYREAECAKQDDGECEWVQSDELKDCMESKKNESFNSIEIQ